jgi:hypothetical protein
MIQFVSGARAAQVIMGSPAKDTLGSIGCYSRPAAPATIAGDAVVVVVIVGAQPCCHCWCTTILKGSVRRLSRWMD